MTVDEFLEDCDCAVEQVMYEKAVDLLAQLEMIRDGKACNCRNCTTGAVEAMNKMIWLICNGNRKLYYKYRFTIDRKTGAVNFPDTVT